MITGYSGNTTAQSSREKGDTRFLTCNLDPCFQHHDSQWLQISGYCFASLVITSVTYWRFNLPLAWTTKDFQLLK
jgi:hypothetical protein